MAIQKIAHAEATPEEPAIVGALEVAFVIVIFSFIFKHIMNDPTHTQQYNK